MTPTYTSLQTLIVSIFGSILASSLLLSAAVGPVSLI
jgi:hypothetical protein